MHKCQQFKDNESEKTVLRKCQQFDEDNNKKRQDLDENENEVENYKYVLFLPLALFFPS